MRCRFLRMLLTMTCLTLAVTACAPKVQRVAVLPPDSLLAPCPRPTMPEAMMRGSIRDYAVAATRYIIDLEEAFAVCSGKLAGVSKWRDAMSNDIGTAR